MHREISEIPRRGIGPRNNCAGGVVEYPRRDSNISQQTRDFPSESTGSGEKAAQKAARQSEEGREHAMQPQTLDAPGDLELQRLIDAWPRLSAECRRYILSVATTPIKPSN